jgi:hypothetical protein
LPSRLQSAKRRGLFYFLFYFFVKVSFCQANLFRLKAISLINRFVNPLKRPNLLAISWLITNRLLITKSTKLFSP